MASAVYSEAQSRPHSIRLDSLPSSSPFPSPGSSFLPPPTPGAHEFAMKPPPHSSRRDSRKSSLVPQTTSASSSPRNSALHASTPSTTKPPSSEAPSASPVTMNGHTTKSPRSSAALSTSAQLSSDADETSAVTPTPSAMNIKERPSADSDTTMEVQESPPAPIKLPSPSEFEESPPTAQPLQPQLSPPLQVHSAQPGTKSRPTSMSSQPPSSYTFSDSPAPNSRRVSTASNLAYTPELTSNRPAPPSPALSRRVSQAPSTMSTLSNSSKTGEFGSALSRANSRRSRKSNRFSQLQMTSPMGGKVGGSPLASPSRTAFFSQEVASSPAAMSSASPASAAGPSPASKRASAIAPPPVTTTTARVLIKVRDYGFDEDDRRFEGRGGQVPRPNRIKVLTRRLISSFTTQTFTVDDSGKVVLGAESDKRRKRREKEEEEERKEREAAEKSGRKLSTGGSWGRKKGKGKGKGGLGSRLSWGWSSNGEGDGYEDDDSDDWSDSEDEGKMNGEAEDQYAEGPSSWDILKRLSTWRSSFSQGHGNENPATRGSVIGSANLPSQTDLDRNFAAEEEEDEDDEGDYHDAVEYEDDEEYEEGEYGDEEEPLYPGLYRAMYAFEPEGTAEMRLVEEQVVRVVGRGGGVGWAVVVCEDEDAETPVEGGEKKVKHALVPESYLEPVQLDHEVEAGQEPSVSA